MKKRRLIILLISISFINYSQTTKIKYGIQAGLNLSKLRGYDIPLTFGPGFTESPAFGFLGGLNLEYLINEKLSFKLELNYERKSQKQDNKINFSLGDIGITAALGDEVIVKRNWDYIIIPLLLKYNFSNQNSFYLNGGPYVGYLVDSRENSGLYGNGSLKESETRKTTYAYNKTDVGLSIGVGKMIGVALNSSIFIEIRGNVGLTKLSKNKIFDDGYAKTNSVNFILGYSMN